MIVCWHGYGTGCNSVATESLIDEECLERDWFFLSITAVHDKNYGYLLAQQHCTAAIDYVIDDLGYSIDTSRIYMAGFSMGAGAACSYACRHMGEKYAVAGLILVSGLFDWIDAYDHGDPGVVTWITYLLGGTPTEVPFKWHQISTLYVSDHTYDVDLSMGQNLRHGRPALFITYAGNDGQISYLGPQQVVFMDMLDDLGGEYLLDYYVFSLTPHSWLLLDVEYAFDYLESFTLLDPDPSELNLLVDRSSEWFWTDIDTNDPEAFCRFTSQAIPAQNKLVVQEATNMDGVTADCSQFGMGAGQTLWIDYRSTDGRAQELILEQIDTEPTYVVDENGLLYPDAHYDALEQNLSVAFAPPVDEYLKASYEAYNLTLTATDPVQIGEVTTINMGGGDPFDPFILVVALEQKETKVSYEQYMLISPAFPALWIQYVLDAQGEIVMEPRIPDDGSLIGVNLYLQFITHSNKIKEKSNLQVIHIIE